MSKDHQVKISGASTEVLGLNKVEGNDLCGKLKKAV